MQHPGSAGSRGHRASGETMTRRILRIALIGACLLVLWLGAAGAYLLYAPAPEVPVLSGSLEHDSVRVGEATRRYAFYAPARLAPRTPLVLALHGSMGSAGKMRRETAYGFERLADEHGFIVVYPEGFQGHWNDCRKQASYSAKRLNIDDVGFLRALIAQFRTSHDVDSARVFVVGLSNGAHMGYRLALEAPEIVRGVAAVAANLPTEDNSDCVPVPGSVPVLILNGTEDPINPYDGGRVTLFGFGNRGTVLSARQSAEFFARRNGITDAPVAERIAQDRSTSTSAERTHWRSDTGADVVLYTIHGGGHALPQPHARFPRLLGRTHAELDGPAEIWRFFSTSISVPFPGSTCSDAPSCGGQ